MNEVKRQAVSELQKAVAAAESKATELVNSERSKMERTISARDMGSNGLGIKYSGPKSSDCPA